MKLETSYIYIKGVRFHAYIGVSELERKVGNDYVADLRLCYHIGKAMLTDNVNDTISYADVYELAKEVMEQPSQLLEHVAARLLQQLFRHFPQVQRATVEVQKDNPPMGADLRGCSVRLSATRAEDEA